MSKQPKLGKRQRTALVDLVNAGGVWDPTDENIRRRYNDTQLKETNSALASLTKYGLVKSGGNVLWRITDKGRELASERVDESGRWRFVSWQSSPEQKASEHMTESNGVSLTDKIRKWRAGAVMYAKMAQDIAAQTAEGLSEPDRGKAYIDKLSRPAWHDPPGPRRVKRG